MTLYLVLDKIDNGSGKWTDIVKTSDSGLVAMGNSVAVGASSFAATTSTVKELYDAALLDRLTTPPLRWANGSLAVTPNSSRR